MMPTPPPHWPPWPGTWLGSAGDRPQLSMFDVRRLRELRLEWARHRMRPVDVEMYSPNQIRHLIRLVGSAPTALPPRNREIPLWRLPEAPNYSLFSFMKPRTTPAPPDDARQMWEAVFRGWVVVMFLLAILVAIMRKLQRCMDKRLFKLRSRQSEEWSTPNVFATSDRGNVDGEPTGLDSGAYSEGIVDNGNDLPPPYSECANTEDNYINTLNKLLRREEPPPPYSACYVAFANPKDGVPSVHFYDSQRQNIFDRGREDSDNNGEPSSSNEENRVTFVFENGSVLEREEDRIDDREASTVRDSSTAEVGRLHAVL